MREGERGRGREGESGKGTEGGREGEREGGCQMQKCRSKCSRVLRDHSRTLLAKSRAVCSMAP